MKRALIMLVAGTLLSGAAAWTASTADRSERAAGMPQTAKLAGPLR